MLKKYLCVLIAVLAVLISFSGCVSTKSVELVPGTAYVSAERIYTNH